MRATVLPVSPYSYPAGSSWRSVPRRYPVGAAAARMTVSFAGRKAGRWLRKTLKLDGKQYVILPAAEVPAAQAGCASRREATRGRGHVLDGGGAEG